MWVDKEAEVYMHTIHKGEIQRELTDYNSNQSTQTTLCVLHAKLMLMNSDQLCFKDSHDNFVHFN